MFGGYGRRRNSFYDPYAAPGLGIDVTDGDLVENLGGGLGIDLETGDLELEIAPGLDIDLGGW
jgi:hypothetical protein